MSETLRDRNASMPDCTLSGARTKKAVLLCGAYDRGHAPFFVRRDPKPIEQSIISDAAQSPSICKD